MLHTQVDISMRYGSIGQGEKGKETQKKKYNGQWECTVLGEATSNNGELCIKATCIWRSIGNDEGKQDV